jgi:hypothetical protein
VTVLKKKFSAVKEKKMWVIALNMAYNAGKRREPLKWIFRKLYGGRWRGGGGWTELVWFRLGAKSIP